MDAKYAPLNRLHRKQLAENIIRMCVGSGYVIDFDCKEREMVFKKSINENTIRVYTSVDKRTHMMRTVGRDAVRVAVVAVAVSATVGIFRRNLYPSGELRKIEIRVAKALKDAERRAARPS